MGPIRSKSSDLTRDQRIQILALRGIGWTYDQIASSLQCTRRQVQDACEAGHPTPTKRSDRPSLLSPDQIKTLIEFICTSFQNR